MFWGLNLKPNRKYTQKTSKPFHISLASLDIESGSVDGANQIYINHDNQKFLICTLRKGSCEQVMLDLNFSEGDEICFQCIGSGNVSLTGYLIDKFNFMDDDIDDDEESDSEEVQDLRQALNKKANAKKNTNAKKQAASNEEEDDDDDEEDSDFNGEGLGEVEEDSDEEDEEDDDDDDDEEDEDDEEEDEDESEDEEVQQPKAKQPKLDKPLKQQNGVAKESAADKKGKKDKKANKNEQQPQKQQQKVGGERVITGGVKIEDVRIGNGPEAKSGKRAQVYYEGRLKSNNKVFDSLKTGAGFKFGLGRGEVIKGWDVGVVGMKVGGKRRITCPPHMAYGARGSPPTIPPNSTLVFEVELKGVH